jgi:solute carrier family 66 (lysosomal lysine-arginine transporter), member 1
MPRPTTPISASTQPALPPHCDPTTPFLYRFSSAFHTCVPTPLAFTSNIFGALSIVAWLFAQLPQIYKNWSISSTSGLSIFFLVEWCLGDVSNLLGALFTHQASWQVTIGAYYVFVDLCLVAQWVWYEKLRHGRMVRRIWPSASGGRYDEEGTEGGMGAVIDGMPISQSNSAEVGNDEDDAGEGHGDKHGKQPSRPRRIIFRQLTFEKEDEKPSSSLSATPNSRTIHRHGASSSPVPSPSPRTVLLIACLLAVVRASPITVQIGLVSQPTRTSYESTPLETAGTVLSWLSTVLYLGSRLPQLLKNFRRKSTAGLSPHLFLAAFCGNLFYSAALLTNPCAWSSFGPYGGGGWVGPEGSERTHWVLAALPFFLGAAGVLGMDGSVGVQFLMYAHKHPGEEGPVVVVLEEDKWHRRHWRRVSGWMRGWVPGLTTSGEGPKEEGDREREGLLQRGTGGGGEGYGAAA